MNSHEAIAILELSTTFTARDLKHHYYLKALKYHPDKNHDPDATGKFQEVLAAFQYLREHANTNTDTDTNTEAEVVTDDASYMTILENFMKGVDKNIDVVKLLSIFNNDYTDLSLKLLQQCPKKTLVRLRPLLTLYADVLHINSRIVDEYNKLVGDLNTGCDDQVIIINPTLENLMNDEVYKLVIDSEVYYIPLWHHELVFDVSGRQMVVQCDPVLPAHLELDQYNNMFMSLTIGIANLLTLVNLTFVIGPMTYTIPVAELRIKRHQRYTIRRKGLPRINTKDVYNIMDRANIYVDITTF